MQQRKQFFCFMRKLFLQGQIKMQSLLSRVSTEAVASALLVSSGVVNPVVERFRAPQAVRVVELKQIDASARVCMAASVDFVLAVASVDGHHDGHGRPVDPAAAPVPPLLPPTTFHVFAQCFW